MRNIGVASSTNVECIIEMCGAGVKITRHYLNKSSFKNNLQDEILLYYKLYKKIL